VPSDGTMLDGVKYDPIGKLPLPSDWTSHEQGDPRKA
jgi:hypothetical protein